MPEKLNKKSPNFSKICDKSIVFGKTSQLEGSFFEKNRRIKKIIVTFPGNMGHERQKWQKSHKKDFVDLKINLAL